MKLLREIYCPEKGDITFRSLKGTSVASNCLGSVEEAIMFFSNSDSDRLIQFMHFRPRDHVSSRDFDPYGMLRISSQNTASLTPPFATISQLGMCMNLNDGTSEFSTLAEFVIEFGRFRLLRTLPFFRDYIVRKTVGGFYGRIRRIRFERALERVRSRSLLAFTQLLGKDLYLIISTSLFHSLQPH